MSVIAHKDTISTGKPIEKLGPKAASEILRYNFDVIEFPLKRFMVRQDWCLISPLIAEEKTAGGLILPDVAREVDEYISQAGKIEILGPLFYQLEPWNKDHNPPKVGDYVFIKPYVSQRVVFGGNKFLLTPQTAITATFDAEEIKELNINMQIFT